MPPRPRATTKRTTTVKKPARPRVARAADNPVDAEATGALVLMRWHGETLTIDLNEVQFGRAAFALRRAANDNLPLMTRVNAMLDVVESALGEEQLARAYELTPRMFDDTTVMEQFWTAFNTAVHGAAPGESSASSTS